jgi:hypothetical protein
MRLFITLFVSLVFFFLVAGCGGGQPLVKDNTEHEEIKGFSSDTDLKRLALVIGNGKYKNIPSLSNPVNDAKDMKTALKSLGYEVMLKTNVGRKAMIETVQDFGDKLRSQGGIGLFYFSGHGLQAQGINYLVPNDANINSEADIEFASVKADRVLAQMKPAKNQVEKCELFRREELVLG